MTRLTEGMPPQGASREWHAAVVPIARDLSGFTGVGYDKGRGKLTQAVWFATSNLVFMAWWFPPKLRPPLLRLFGARVGHNVFIRHRVRVLWPWKLTVGDDSWIGEDVWLLNLESIDIGHDVCLSQGVVVCTGSHNWRSGCFEFDNAPVTIHDHSWVAMQALILRGVTVHRGAVVGARSTVAKDVPSGVRIIPSAGSPP